MLQSARDKLLSIRDLHPWMIVAGLGSWFLVVFSGVDRLLQWDEGVFFSQSGGYRGVPAPPVSVGPGREGGPIGLIWLVRQFGLDLHSVRLTWVIVVLIGALGAFWLVSRSVGRFEGVTGLVVYLFFWITWVASGFLHGPMIAGIAGLTALAAYDVAVRSKGRVGQALAGVVLGAALALMFWFRPVESGVIAGAVVLFSLIFDLTRFWFKRPLVWVSAGIVVVTTFFIPWAIWSTRQFGSVLDRLQGMTGRVTAAKWSLHWGTSDWIDLVTGHRRTFGLTSSTPPWANAIIVAGMAVVAVAVVFVGIRGVMMWRRGDVDKARVRLLAVIAFSVPTVLYLFLRTDTQERYASLWWIFASWIVALAIGDMRSQYPSWKPSIAIERTALALGLFLGVVWIAAQIGVASSFQTALSNSEQATGRPAQFTEPLVDSGSCAAGARYNIPLHQVITGCKVFSVSDADSVTAIAERIEQRGTTGYLYWSGDRDDVVLGEDWFIPEGIDWGKERTLWVYQQAPSE